MRRFKRKCLDMYEKLIRVHPKISFEIVLLAFNDMLHFGLIVICYCHFNSGFINSQGLFFAQTQI